MENDISLNQIRAYLADKQGPISAKQPVTEALGATCYDKTDFAFVTYRMRFVEGWMKCSRGWVRANLTP